MKFTEILKIELKLLMILSSCRYYNKSNIWPEKPLWVIWYKQTNYSENDEEWKLLVTEGLSFNPLLPFLNKFVTSSMKLITLKWEINSKYYCKHWNMLAWSDAMMCINDEICESCTGFLKTCILLLSIWIILQLSVGLVLPDIFL